MGLQELIIGLVLGSYGFTWACYRMLVTKIDDMITNHLSHFVRKKSKKKSKK